eukprot:scaffold121161_cov30-Attheya_sp.AAC.1
MKSGAGLWNPDNTRELLQYTARKWPHFPHGFELGNEKEHLLAPEDVAHCYVTLRSMVNELWPTPGPGRPLVVGPALNLRPDWLSLFLSSLPTPTTTTTTTTLDAITYHLYPGYGPSKNLVDLIPTASWLDHSHTLIARMQRATKHHHHHFNLWVGETAAAWASGAGRGFCDGFLSSIWYMDILGHAATTGHGA